MITYNLKLKDKSSGIFYSSLKEFSKEVLDKINLETETLLPKYALYLQNENNEPPRSMGEYAIEFLTFAMALDRYLGASQKTPLLQIHILRFLFWLRSKTLFLKTIIDPIRGFWAGFFFVPHIGAKSKGNNKNLKALARLLYWLEATGEFRDEIKRLTKWKKFLKTLPSSECYDFFCKASEVFRWFKKQAHQELGPYTTGVASFLEIQYPAYRLREDEIFCGKEEVEYHLNMVGSEIINWGLRDEFREMKKRVVLVPGCMRIKPEHQCPARSKGLDIICTGCSSECNVNRIVKLGQKNNFNVFIVPHTTSFTKWLRRYQNTQEYGVVAVACLLNIVVGGYQMRELKIPSQCVLLDYCGCKKHWHPQGITTDLNDHRLVKVTTEGA